MAAITVASISAPKPGGSVFTYYGTGTANQTDTLTSTAVGGGYAEKLLWVSVKYSASTTQAGVTIGIDSGLGSAYDTTITTGSANIQNTFFFPDHGEVWLGKGDAIVVTAPQGGVGITAAIVICTERA